MSVERVRAYLACFGKDDCVQEFDVSSATVELAAQAVVQNLKVGLGQLCGLLHPDVGQLAPREGDALDLLPLPLVVHPAEDDLPAGGTADQHERRLAHRPIPLRLVPEEAVSRPGQLGVGAVPVGHVALAHAQEIAPRLAQQAQEVVLGGVHALAAAGAPLEHHVAPPRAVRPGKDPVGRHGERHGVPASSPSPSGAP